MAEVFGGIDYTRVRKALRAELLTTDDLREVINPITLKTFRDHDLYVSAYDTGLMNLTANRPERLTIGMTATGAFRVRVQFCDADGNVVREVPDEVTASPYEHDKEYICTSPYIRVVIEDTSGTSNPATGSIYIR